MILIIGFFKIIIQDVLIGKEEAKIHARKDKPIESKPLIDESDFPVSLLQLMICSCLYA